MKTQIKHSLIAATVIMAFGTFTGCSDSSSGTEDGSVANNSVLPEITTIEGDQLACGRTEDAVLVDGYPDSVVSLPADLPIQRINISKKDTDDTDSKVQPNAQNTLKRMNLQLPSVAANGTLTGEATDYVHPLIVSYAEQVVGPYELGDGSADIGDPNTADDIFVSLSLDNGKTWKKENVSNTVMRGDALNSSILVNWTADKGAAATTPYPGHSHKPKMAVNGKHILVAWHDKFCPSGDPLGLYVKDEDGAATDVLVDPEQSDYYKVNGKQGSINYELPCTIEDDPNTATNESNCAPNGKEVYEVPFSCIWTARGVMDTEDEDNVSVTWYKPEQLTTGTRDANKVWIATSWDTSVGFALAWQEDPEGLRQGQGAGPGEGWSGATTNHGADIWYTHIAADKFEAIDEEFVEPEDADTVVDATKPKALNNFAYPVRVTDNEVCKEDDTKLYCQDIACSSYVVSKDEEPTDDATAVTSGKCVTNVLDPLWDDGTTVILDGDTGASRPAMSILKTNEGEDVVIFAYEETKGLSESNSADADQGETDTEIEYEGKVALFNSFLFDQPLTINAGTIVNPKAPDATDTTKMIYENARRVVIVNQIDACDQKEGDFTFGIMYKQGIETRGGSSDMFVRMNKGFQPDTFVTPDEVKNLSSMPLYIKADHEVDGLDPEDFWTEGNLEDETYTNLAENTFSPRGFMRGSDIFIGFEYTPNWAQTEQGNEPNTFYINRFVNGAWDGPKEISKVVGPKVSTLDPRFFPTPKERYTLESSGMPTEKSNPNVLFLTYGTFDMQSGLELDLFYTYSTDYGKTWNHVERETDDGNVTADAKLAAVSGIEEKEVQTIVSPDGTMIWNVWIQEEEKEHYDANLEILDEEGNDADHFGGLDSWSARVDFNATE